MELLNEERLNEIINEMCGEPTVGCEYCAEEIAKAQLKADAQSTIDRLTKISGVSFYTKQVADPYIRAYIAELKEIING